MAYRLDGLKAARLDSGVSATGTVGAGANGVVTATITEKGTPGNLYTIRTVLGAGISQPLAVTLVGTVITITLATDGDELPDAAANTATLIAAAVDALDGITAAASGSGVTAISTAQGPNAFSGGLFAATIGDIAKRAVLNTKYYRQIETGRPCTPAEAARIAAALNTTLVGLSAAAV